MTSIAKGNLSEFIISEVKKFHQAITSKEIAFNLNTSKSEIEKTIAKKLPMDIIKYDGKDGMILISTDLREKFRRGIFAAIKEFKKQNPYIDKGASLSEIRAGLKIEIGSAAEEVLKELLDYQLQKGNLKEKDKTWMLAGDFENKDKKMESHTKFFSDYLKSFNMQTPLQSQLRLEAEKRKLSEKELKQILSNMTSSGEVYRMKDEYIHASIVDSCREKLIAELTGKEKGMTVAEFRNLVDGNRKICLLLLAQYDSEMLTKRVGDVRMLVKKS
jgi:hypothetical protein